MLTEKVTVSKSEMDALRGEDGWFLGKIRKISFARHPGWIGYVRKDGTGIAVNNPTNDDLRILRETMTQSLFLGDDSWSV